MAKRYKPPIKGWRMRIGELFGMKNGDTDHEEYVIDVDDEGHSLFKEDIIQKVLEDLEKRKT